jgi:tripartite ATP-independent transporter DctM subunit
MNTQAPSELSDADESASLDESLELIELVEAAVPAPPPFWVRAIGLTSLGMAMVSGAATLFLGLQVITDAGSRTILNSPLPGTLEMVANWWMVLAVFLALGYAQLRNEHIRVTMLTDPLAPRLKRNVQLTFLVIAAAGTFLLAYYAFRRAVHATGMNEMVLGSTELLVWPIRWLVVVGLVVLGLQFVASMWTTTAAAKLEEGEAGPLSSLGFFIFAAVSVLLIAVVAVVPTDRGTSGLLILALVVVLTLVGIHAAVAIFLSSVLGLWKLGGMRILEGTLQDVPYAATANWGLSVVPMFIFMGIVLWRSGLTGAVFATMRLWLGRMPGGLAVATNYSGAGLAAASGSTIGIAYALGRMAIPEMLRAGYKTSLATGVVTMAGTLGQLIPPSVLLVLYAGVAQTPVGPQLMAAIIPGVIVAVGYGTMIIVHAKLDPSIAPLVDTSAVDWNERFKSLIGLLPIGFVILVLIGGMFSGIFTPTEAGAFGALSAVVMGFLFGEGGRGKVFWSRVLHSLRDTVAAVAGIFFLLIAVNLLARAITISGITRTMADWVVGLGLSPLMFLLVLIVFFLIVCMFMDELAVLMLAIPIMTPVLIAMNIDLLWFGVFTVMLLQLGLVTPPLGMLVLIVHRLAQDPEVNLGQKITLTDVFKGVAPFIAVSVAVLVLLVFFPQLATWLPSIAKAG